MLVSNQQLEVDMEQTCSKSGKGYIKAVYCHPAYLTYMQNGGGLVTKSSPTLTTPWTIACQSPLSMVFFRQEYWNGLPFPSPGNLPNPGIEPGSPALQSLYQLNYEGRPSSK